MEDNYAQQATELSKAIDIAIEAYQKHRPTEFTDEHLELVITFFEETKEQALNPDPQFKKISSLDYLSVDFLREFQEVSGELVDYFWKRIEEDNLPYKQVNRLIQILSGGKIKSYAEYTYVTQSLSTALSNKQITSEEAQQLKVLTASYQKYHSE